MHNDEHRLRRTNSREEQYLELLATLGLLKYKQIKRRQSNSKLVPSRQLVLTTLAVTLIVALILPLDPARLLKWPATSAGTNQAVASWIGSVPTAAQMFGAEASDSPTAEAFDDDDEDEELDASATNEYPDNENDESYEDSDDQDNAESRTSENWLNPRLEVSGARNPAARIGGHTIWSDLEGWRRNRRDLEDRIVLASRRTAQRKRAKEDEFAVEDGDEDAWVHDGIDDIHIDPETKKAASELSHDEKSIDAEYEPQQGPINKTRFTTIAEVIPIRDTDDSSSMDSSTSQQGDSSQVRYSTKPSMLSNYLPASQLTVEQVQRLIAGNRDPYSRNSLEENEEDNLEANSDRRRR